jgi:hypothetical protein
MNANELMVGNHFKKQLPNTEAYIIVELDARSIFDIAYSTEIASLYKPIQITKEWLLKLGFAIKGISIWYELLNGVETEFMIKIRENKTEIYEFYFVIGNVDSRPMHYVHELENIIYTFTGKKLRSK